MMTMVNNDVGVTDTREINFVPKEAPKATLSMFPLFKSKKKLRKKTEYLWGAKTHVRAIVTLHY